MTANEALAAAWTYCAPNRAPDAFPHGFWPDVARVAMEMFAQQTANPSLDFIPTRCVRGSYPEPITKAKTFKGLDLSKLEINL